MVKRSWKFIYWLISLSIVLIPGFFIDIKLSGFWSFLAFVLGLGLFIYSMLVASIAGRTLKLYAHKENEPKTFWPNRFTDIGIYRCMRHPMHLGLGLLPLSIALMWGNVASIIAGGWGVAMALIFVLLIEEPQTLKRFNNYCEYMQRVSAFNFNLSCLKSALNTIKQNKNALTQENSKVEVKGFEAKHYDKLMNIITFGWYEGFINKAIKDLGLKEGDKVIDFGAGTGKNALIMRKFVKKDGFILGVDIGDEMSEQFLQKTAPYDNIKLLNKSILEPFDTNQKFDMVFISFVLHGFTQENREKIIKNAYNLLKDGGIFAILDYNEFDVDKAPFYIKTAIRKVECPLAEDFIKQDLKEMLKANGFKEFNQKEYFKGYLRLMLAKK
jgi:demethylmenaquinone methyltransferase/2-methoxy-6-polyprenyl-1,4-benzoquinol methylase